MRFYSILFVILGFTAKTHANIDLQLMHTTPVCNHEGKTPAWCTYEDLIPSADAAGMVNKINAQIDLAVDPAKAKIYVAYFSFSNKPIFKKLCEKATAGVPIEFFLDSSYRGNKLASDLVACGTNNNVRLHFIGKMDTSNPSDIIWRLHHNKFLIVDSGDGQPVKINFSSGNLSAYGTSLHFDHWVTVTAPADSNIYKTHQCVVKSMLMAIDPDQDGVDADLDDPEIYRQTLDACLKQMTSLRVEDAIAKETIAPLFSPNPKNEIANTLVNEVKKIQAGDTIRGAIQHFTHTSIARSLVDACNRGVKVQMIMDDDILSGESEVPGVKEFFDAYLDNTCVQVQFMQTNAAGFQMMHNKFLILGTKRVFAGAGHFTYSAMTKNYENFYLMQTDSIVNQYNGMFDSMWQWSLDKKAAEESLAQQAEEAAQQEEEEVAPTPPPVTPTPEPTPVPEPTPAPEATPVPTVEINDNYYDVPQAVLDKAAQAIASHCKELPPWDLDLVNVTVKKQSVDQGQTDTIYVMEIEIPNTSNDDDEDLIDVTVVDASISNPAIENPSVVSLDATGWVKCNPL